MEFAREALHAAEVVSGSLGPGAVKLACQTTGGKSPPSNRE